MKTFKAIFAIMVLFAFVACNTETNNTDVNADTTAVKTTENKPATVNSDADRVFINIPSPVETAIIMANAGAKFDETLLNPLENRNNYTTSLSKALNLGVYSADLSFASMFDQPKISVQYLAVNQQLADELGVLDAISQDMLDRMESNIDKKDSLMQIISETLMNSEIYLKENERAEIAATILAGGWIEGLYITSQIAKTTEENQSLIERIVDQKLTLQDLQKLLADYQDAPSIQTFIGDLNEIGKTFEKVMIKNSKMEAVTDEATKKTVLQSTREIEMAPEVFEELLTKIEMLRTRIIKGEII